MLGNTRRRGLSFKNLIILQLKKKTISMNGLNKVSFAYALSS